MSSIRVSRRRGRPSRTGTGNDTGELRQKLIQAALEVFGSSGFEGASLSRIAAVAGTDVALTRYYFGSKEDLWKSAIDALSIRLSADLATELAESDLTGTEQLKRVIRWFIRISADNPYLSRIIVHDGDDTGDRGEYIARRLVGPFYDVMARLIKKAKREGSVPHVSTRTIFFMITHGGSFPMAMPSLTNAFPGGNISSAVALRRHADALIALVLQKRSNE